MPLDDYTENEINLMKAISNKDYITSVTLQLIADVRTLFHTKAGLYDFIYGPHKIRDKPNFLVQYPSYGYVLENDLIRKTENKNNVGSEMKTKQSSRKSDPNNLARPYPIVKDSSKPDLLFTVNFTSQHVHFKIEVSPEQEFINNVVNNVLSEKYLKTVFDKITTTFDVLSSIPLDEYEIIPYYPIEHKVDRFTLLQFSKAAINDEYPLLRSKLKLRKKK